MISRMLLWAVLLCLLPLVPASARANDAAASLSAGGITLRDERRVSMQKERLQIVETKGGGFSVTVEYEFLNESAKPVSTEIAFPLPRHVYAYSSLEGPRDLGGFRAWVDGVRIKPAKEVRAFAKGKDIAPTLRALGVDVETHGRFEPEDGGGQLRALSKEKRARLVELGALELKEGFPGVWPLWEVATTWHWKQVFPPGKVVRVKHEYTPAAGFSYETTGVRPYVARLAAELGDACFDPAALSALERRYQELPAPDPMAGVQVYGFWVDYVLTTANTWKTPIRDFELVVQAPEGSLVSFCWPGKVERVGKTSLRVRERDFVPKRELRVVFLSLD